MNIHFQHAKLTDLNAIMEVEHSGFNPAEALTKAAMTSRIQNLSDTFIVAKAKDKVIGFVVGPAYHKRYLDDALYTKLAPNRPDDQYQTILSIAVLPKYQGQESPVGY